jgi:hypothetical protein
VYVRRLSKWCALVKKDLREEVAKAPPVKKAKVAVRSPATPKKTKGGEPLSLATGRMIQRVWVTGPSLPVLQVTANVRYETVRPKDPQRKEKWIQVKVENKVDVVRVHSSAPTLGTFTQDGKFRPNHRGRRLEKRKGIRIGDRIPKAVLPKDALQAFAESRGGTKPANRKAARMNAMEAAEKKKNENQRRLPSTSAPPPQPVDRTKRFDQYVMAYGNSRAWAMAAEYGWDLVALEKAGKRRE